MLSSRLDFVTNPLPSSLSSRLPYEEFGQRIRYRLKITNIHFRSGFIIDGDLTLMKQRRQKRRWKNCWRVQSYAVDICKQDGSPIVREALTRAALRQGIILTTRLVEGILGQVEEELIRERAHILSFYDQHRQHLDLAHAS